MTSTSHHHQRPMKGMERRTTRSMDRELGKLVSSVRDDDHSFEIILDVSQFTPEEISVKTTDRNIVIHGKHAERTDQHGYVSREFRRRVMIPKGVNPDTVTSTITSDGIITITAPKLALEGLNERVIPVVLTPSNAKDKEDEHLKTKVVAGHSNNGSGDVEGSKPKAG